MKGGGPYTSASSYGTYVSGSTNAQYDRVFGPEYANVPGNVIIGAQGQNLPPMSQIPTPTQLSLAQSGGKRKKRMGGNQGFVPMQNISSRNLNPQGNPWGILAGQSDPRMAYATGMVTPQMAQQMVPPQMGPQMGQSFSSKSGGTRDDLYTEPFNRLTGAVKELAEALNQPVFPFAYLNKTIKQQENENVGGRRRRTRRHRRH
jgi:hypothetical protein